jgi:hypothetical protein
VGVGEGPLRDSMSLPAPAVTQPIKSVALTQKDIMLPLQGLQRLDWIYFQPPNPLPLNIGTPPLVLVLPMIIL